MTVPTSPSWYDVLGVDEDADADAIRSAFRAGIADLDPTDRRFRLLTQAAEVLLDQRNRDRYDATLTISETRPGGPEPQQPPTRGRWLTKREPNAQRDAARSPRSAHGKRDAGAVTLAKPAAQSPAADTDAGTERDPRASAAPTRRGPSSWLLVPVALLTALAVAVAVALLTQPSDGAIADSTDQAQSAAEHAATVILAYDYRHMDADQHASDALMTSSYAAKYDALFAQLKANSTSTQTVVTASAPLASGIVRSGDDRVQVLVFIDQARTNAQSQTPTIYHNQVRITMVKSGGDWLVDDLATSPTTS